MQGLTGLRRTDGQRAVANAIAACSLLLVRAEGGARAVTLIWEVLVGGSGSAESDEEEGCDRGELHFG